jgi:hypothetical protein
MQHCARRNERINTGCAKRTCCAEQTKPAAQQINAEAEQINNSEADGLVIV